MKLEVAIRRSGQIMPCRTRRFLTKPCKLCGRNVGTQPFIRGELPICETCAKQHDMRWQPAHIFEERWLMDPATMTDEDWDRFIDEGERLAQEDSERLN